MVVIADYSGVFGAVCSAGVKCRFGNSLGGSLALGGGSCVLPLALRVELVQVLHHADQRVDAPIGELALERGHGVAEAQHEVLAGKEDGLPDVVLRRGELLARADVVLQRRAVGELLLARSHALPERPPLEAGPRSPRGAGALRAVERVALAAAREEDGARLEEELL